MTQNAMLSVHGMSCTACERNVRFTLSSIDGVEDVRPDHGANTVWVAYDAGVTSLETIRRAVEDIGYRVDADD